MGELRYFFSYSRHDAPLVLKLAQELRTVGVDLWLDQLDIVGGQRWDRAVEEALSTCNGMIAVLSPESLASNNVMDEISYALESDKLVVPILLRTCTIPFRLRRVQHVNFIGDYDRAFSQLLRALNIERRSEIAVPSFGRVGHASSLTSVAQTETTSPQAGCLLPPTGHVEGLEFQQDREVQLDNSPLPDSAAASVPSVRHFGGVVAAASTRLGVRHPRLSGGLRVALIGVTLNLLLNPISLWIDGFRYLTMTVVFSFVIVAAISSLLWFLAGLVAGGQKQSMAWVLVPACLVVAVWTVAEGHKGFGNGIVFNGIGAIVGTVTKRYLAYRASPAI
jgi:hypothetical protein